VPNCPWRSGDTDGCLLNTEAACLTVQVRLGILARTTTQQKLRRDTIADPQNNPEET